MAAEKSIMVTLHYGVNGGSYKEAYLVKSAQTIASFKSSIMMDLHKNGAAKDALYVLLLPSKEMVKLSDSNILSSDMSLYVKPRNIPACGACFECDTCHGYVKSVFT